MLTSIFKTALIVCLAAVAMAAQQPNQKNKSCSLLSKAEIQQALGAATGDGIPARGMDSCRFQVTGDPARMVTLTISRDPAADAAKKVAVMKQSMKGSKITDLTGLGDRAVLIESNGIIAQVSVFRGPDNLLVSVMAPGSMQKGVAAAEALARKAFAHF